MQRVEEVLSKVEEVLRNVLAAWRAQVLEQV